MPAYPALVLNADFRPLSSFPLSLLDWQDTIKAVVRDTVSIVAEYDRVVRSPSVTMKIPSVVALRTFVPPPKHVAFTRSNLFLRDHFTCQYCGVGFRAKQLTFDHVIPRSQGGKTSWLNVVAACEPCNTGKAHKMIMKPMRPPHIPTARELALAALKFPPERLHKTWTDYLYWSSELISE